MELFLDGTTQVSLKPYGKIKPLEKHGIS
ncbi:uncharacterized protein METZ01_LOCUS84665, partial [marine metagenome]